jgi:hypothetical protein
MTNSPPGKTLDQPIATNRVPPGARMFRPSIPIARGAALLAVNWSVTGIGSDQTNARGRNRKAVKLLDLMLEFFADDGHWTRGR